MLHRRGSSRRAVDTLSALASGSNSNAGSDSGRSSPVFDGDGGGRGGKSGAFRAATHIGSVVDDWPMYSAQASDYVIGPVIGFGASSVVHQASFLPLDGRACAVKVIDLEAFGRDLAELRRETQLMSLSKHPNVLRVRGCWVEGSKLHIATRFMSSGSILDIMRFTFPDGMEESVIATVLKQALEGLNYLHINGWLHRDLKAANMLVDEDGTVLLGDFGVGVFLDEGLKIGTGGSSAKGNGHASHAANVSESEKIDSINQAARKSFVGTPCWMAPEVVERKGYGAKADIWSFGITALELASGRAPHSRLPPVKVLMRTLQDEPPTLDRKGGAYKYSKIFDDFVKQCLQKDPHRRPTAQQLLGHAFFKQAKSGKHLVNTILAGLPPLSERQLQTRAMSMASLANNLSWDFNTTTHGTNSRLHTPYHERGDPFQGFSGIIAPSPRGSVRSARAPSGTEGLPRTESHDDSVLVAGLPRRSRPPSGEYGFNNSYDGASPMPKGSWGSRRRSRTQRSNVSFDIHEEGDEREAHNADGADDEAEVALASSTGDLGGSGMLPPIKEHRSHRRADEPSSEPHLSSSPALASTPPLVHDSKPSSQANSSDCGSEAEHASAASASADTETKSQASPSLMQAPSPRVGKTREAFSKLFRRPA